MYYDDFDLTDLMIRRNLIMQIISTVRGTKTTSFELNNEKLIREYLEYDLKMITNAINARVEELKEGQGEQ